MKNFKKKIFVLVIFFSVLIYFGSDYYLYILDSPTIRKNPIVGISMHEIGGRWAKDVFFLRKHLRKKKSKVYITNAKNDYKLQYKQVKKLILKRRISALIIVAEDCDKAAKIVELANKHNVKVIAYDRLILNCKLDYFVSNNGVRVGELLVERALKSVPFGNYVLLGGGIHDENSRLVNLGVHNVLQPKIDNNDIKVIFEKYTENWGKQEGKSMIKSLIDKKVKIDVVIAANDNLALGAIEAIEESKNKLYNVNKIYFSGQDATVEACRSLLAGKLKHTVYKPVNKMALAAATLAIDISNKKELPEIKETTNNGNLLVPTIIIKNILTVDMNNLDKTVVLDKYHSKQEVYK